MEACANIYLPLPWLPHVEWAWAVLLAHRVFGTLTIGLMMCWAMALSQITTVACSYALAGMLTAACGVWLMLWVIVLMKPAASTSEMIEFAWHDVTQEQHFVMGLLLAAAGCTELFHAVALHSSERALGERRWPHTIWLFNMAMVGLIFVGHPQRSWGETQRHVAIGLSMIAGAFLLTLEKNDGMLDGDQDIFEAPNIVGAALSFGVTAVLLFTFPAPRSPQRYINSTANSSINVSANLTNNNTTDFGGVQFHVGIATHCQQGHPLALIGLAVALLSFVLLFAAAAYDRGALHSSLRAAVVHAHVVLGTAFGGDSVGSGDQPGSNSSPSKGSLQPPNVAHVGLASRVALSAYLTSDATRGDDSELEALAPQAGEELEHKDESNGIQQKAQRGGMAQTV